MADATAVFTWLRRRRTSGDMRTNQSPGAAKRLTGQRGTRATSGVEQMTMNAARDGLRKQMDVAQLAASVGAEEFVGLHAPQHVELNGCLIDRRANSEGHQHQADAVLLITIVISVLIKIELLVVQEAI